MKKTLIIVISVVVVFFCIGVFFAGKSYRKYMAMEKITIDPHCTVYLGGGGNSLVLTSEDGSKQLLVDTKMGMASKELVRLIRATDVTIVNTHLHRDHIGGNMLFPKAKIVAGAYTPQQWFEGAHNSRYPDEIIKTGEEKMFQIGSETVHVRNMGRAHTANDVVVYCERRKLLVTGDLVFLGSHPVLYTKSGCSVALWVQVLDSLMAKYDITTLVPGHGNVSDRSALAAMKEYFTSIGESVGSPEKQAALREKYKDYFSLPGMSGFDKTLEFIEKERSSNLQPKAN